MHNESIVIPSFEEAALLFESSKIPEYGIEILLENQLIYFDKVQSIIAFGDVVSQAEVIKFGVGQFIKIRDGKIVAIYIVFQK